MPKKILLPMLAAISFLSSTAQAHPGSHTLICKGNKTQTAAQDVTFSMKRVNAIGWGAPAFSLQVAGKEIKLDSPDENKFYGDYINDAPIGLIYITAANSAYEKNNYHVSIKAIPNTVKAVDTNGKAIKWNIKDERDTCYNSNGKATFQGIFSSDVTTNGQSSSVQPMLVQCTLDYSSGMAC